MGIFASSCENFPNIILEYIGCSFPFISSNYEPMPSITKNLVLYFDPEKPDDIARQVIKMINDYKFRESVALNLSNLKINYSWENCSKKTLSFLYKTFRNHNTN